MRAADRLELVIHDLALGGAGVGRADDGRVVFVQGGVPGDRVRVRVTRRRASFLEAEIVELLAASPQRRHPPCALAGECGGCPWQHIDDEAQSAAKDRLLRNALRRLTIAKEAVFHGAPALLAYRRRVRLGWRRRADGLTLGFVRARSRELIDVRRCPVVVEELNDAAETLRAHLTAWAGPGRGSAILLAGEEGVHLSLRCDEGELPAELGEGGGIVGGVIWQGQRLVERWGLEGVTLDERGIRASAAAFAQANAAQDETLRAWVREWTRGSSGPVLELYCGAGNLTETLARSGRALTAVEVAPEGLFWLRRNLASLDLDVEVLEGRAEVVVKELARQGRTFDGVVLDPPREGAKDVMGPLARLGPSWIVYISCDPMTLARDLGQLQDVGYTLAELRGMDMMPQSAHIEVAARLVRLYTTGGAS